MYKNERNGKLKKKDTKQCVSKIGPFQYTRNIFLFSGFFIEIFSSFYFFYSFPSFILCSVHPPLTSEVRRTISLHQPLSTGIFCACILMSYKRLYVTHMILSCDIDRYVVIC